jgi:hypothetical protein
LPKRIEEREKEKKCIKRVCPAKTREARKHTTFCQKREKREKKVKPKNFQKTPLLSSVLRYKKE